MRVPWYRLGGMASLSVTKVREQSEVQAACKNYLRNRKEYVISKHLKAAKVYSTSFSP